MKHQDVSFYLKIIYPLPAVNITFLSSTCENSYRCPHGNEHDFISCFMLHNMRVLVVGEHFFIISKMSKTSCFKSGHFINIYIINRTSHAGHLGIQILSSHAESISH